MRKSLPVAQTVKHNNSNTKVNVYTLNAMLSLLHTKDDNYDNDKDIVLKNHSQYKRTAEFMPQL